MSCERGYTVVELVIASAVMLVVSSAVISHLHDGLAAAPVIEESADIHQRLRVVADALAGDIAAAAAGTRTGPLSTLFAAVVPRAGAVAATVAATDVLTIRYAPAHGAAGRLLEPLTPASQSVLLDLEATCPSNTVACGFTSNTMAVVFDQDGQADLISVDAIGPATLTVSDVDLPRVVSYPPGARIAEVIEVTYSIDSRLRQLRRREGRGTFTLADHVTRLEFGYFDAASLPLPLPSFTDGPFRGAGRMQFDVDLLRIRTIQATVQFEGVAVGARTIPDLSVRLGISFRNGGTLP